MGAWLTLLVLIASGVTLVVRHDGHTIAGVGVAEIAMGASGLLLAVWLLSNLLPRLRESHPGLFGRALRWGVLGLALLAAIAFKWPLLAVLDSVSARLVLEQPRLAAWMPGWLQPVLASAATPPPPREGDKTVRIRMRDDGHFHAAATINGASLILLVDTGSSAVMLKPADAQRAGIDTGRLSYSVPVETAQGTTYAARVKLRTLKVGVIELGEVEALVAEPGRLESSLLGMSFLSRLRSYEVSREFMTFRG